MTNDMNNETKDQFASNAESESSQVSVKPLLGQLLTWGLGVFFFAATAFGLWLLIDLYNDKSSHTAPEVFIAISMTCLPLFLLGLLVSSSGRYFDRLRLSVSYQDRINKLQNRLHHREDLLSLIADHRSGAVCIFDRQNRYWFVNKAAARNLNRQVMEIIGRSMARVVGNDRARNMEVRLAEARAAACAIERIDRVIDEKGLTRFIQSRYEAIAPVAELKDGVMVTEEDLTSLIVERERRERMLRQVIDTLVAVVDRRDPYAAGHSARVGQLAHAIAEEMGLEPRLVETAEIAGSLMNFGKVLVSRHILTKAAPLTQEELQRVRDSILISADILSIIGFEGPVVQTLRQVLERFDGTGEPEGLKGDDIFITARIVAVANAFVAFVSPRAHRDGLSFQDALKCMMAEADHSYDRRVMIALSNYIENRPNKLDWLMASKQS